MFFEIIGGNNASDLMPKIDELMFKGCILQSIHFGYNNLNESSPFITSDSWKKIDLMFRLGAEVVAVLQSPTSSPFALHYISSCI